jgi:hypothetical protein
VVRGLFFTKVYDVATGTPGGFTKINLWVFLLIPVSGICFSFLYDEESGFSSRFFRE